MAEDGKIIYKVEIDDSEAIPQAEKAGKNAGTAIEGEAEKTTNRVKKEVKVEAQKTGDDIKKTSKQSAKDAGEAAKAETEKKAKDTGKQVKAEAQKTGKGVQDVAEKYAKSSGSKFQEILTGAAREVGASFVRLAESGIQAVGDFFKDSIEVGKEFDASMSQVSATLGFSTNDIKNNVNGAGEVFDKLRAKAKEMGSSTNFTATEAAEGLNILAMSGYTAEQSMNMVEDVLHLAAAGSMDMASAAGFISGSMKGFADETKTSAYYADLMAKGATLANTSVSQLGEAMSGGAAVAASYNQDAKSMTIALLRLAEQGEVGSGAATALSAAMKNLYAPTDQAKKVLKNLGVEAFDPATGKARDFNDVINELDAAMIGFTDEQRTAYAQTIFGIQGFNAYNKMVGASVEKQNEWSEALANSSGEAAKQYDTMTDNLQGDLDGLNSAMDGLKITISDALTPALRDLATIGTESINKLRQGFEEGGVEGAAEAAGQIVVDLTQKLVENLPEMVTTGMEMLGGLITGISSALPDLIPAALEAVLSLAGSLLDNIDQLIDVGISLLNGLAEGLINAVPVLLEKAPIIIAKLFDAIIQNLPKMLEAARNLVYKLAEGIVSNLPALVEKGRDIINAVNSGVQSLISNALTWGKDLIQNFINGLKAKWEALKQTVSNIASTIKDFIGFSEPEKGDLSDFHTFAPDMIDLFDETLDDSTPKLERQLKKTFNVREVIQEAMVPDPYPAELTRMITDTYAGLSSPLSDTIRPVYADMYSREDYEREVSFNMTANGSTGGIHITVPVTLDGREIARASAWAMGEQLAWEEL